MKDHQSSDTFSYSKTWDDIENFLNEVEREQNKHWMAFQRCPKPLRMFHWNNYKGLEGVINALRWVLGDLHMDRNKVLGRDKK